MILLAGLSIFALFVDPKGCLI